MLSVNETYGYISPSPIPAAPEPSLSSKYLSVTAHDVKQESAQVAQYEDRAGHTWHRQRHTGTAIMVCLLRGRNMCFCQPTQVHSIHAKELLAGSLQTGLAQACISCVTLAMCSHMQSAAELCRHNQPTCKGSCSIPAVPNSWLKSLRSFCCCLALGFMRTPRNLGGRPYRSILSMNNLMAQMCIQALNACSNKAHGSHSC